MDNTLGVLFIVSVVNGDLSIFFDCHNSIVVACNGLYVLQYQDLPRKQILEGTTST